MDNITTSMSNKSDANMEHSDSQGSNDTIKITPQFAHHFKPKVSRFLYWKKSASPCSDTFVLPSEKKNTGLSVTLLRGHNTSRFYIKIFTLFNDNFLVNHVVL